ncbi:MAG: fucose isomerase [Firmicutes bacterium]|nr:fucose isomerase [Bacillota bacterium]
MSTMKQITLGVIVGNRGFFPGHLCDSGRKEILSILAEEGIKAIALSPEDTKFGSVESLSDARKCADLFKAHKEEIDGILVTLPNFGDERAVANTIRFSGLGVPVLVHAFPDEVGKMTVENRRDSFCGKMSVCNNLNQYGIPFSLTRLHTVAPSSQSFREDLRWFTAVCRTVNSLRGLRIGAIGTRPAAFNTVRYSEKLLEAAGISVEPIDLSEILGRATRLADGDAAVKEKLDALRAYIDTSRVGNEGLIKMAKFAAVVDRWMKENELAATTVQCWTSIEEFFGVVPCAVMSMMSEALLPSACEVDVPGLIGMYALQQASGKPSALVDWNNNYGDDPDKAVVFHCSNLPKSVFGDAYMDYHQIIAGGVGKENAYGAVVGRIKPGPFTFARVSTDDENGIIAAYVGEGRFTDDPLETFGGYGVIEIPGLQDLLQYICNNGFEHHVAVNLSQTSRVLYEAMDNYLGWDVYVHEGDGD